MRTSRHRRTIVAAVLAAVPTVSLAEDFVWEDSWSDWTNPATWLVNGATPTRSPGAADIAIFPNDPAIANQPDLFTASAIGGIRIDNTGDDYQILGFNTLRLGADSIILDGGGVTTIAAPLFPKQLAPWGIKPGGTFQLNGPLRGGVGISILSGGTVELNYNANNYGGFFLVQNGFLQNGTNANSAGAAFRSNAIEFGANGTLRPNPTGAGGNLTIGALTASVLTSTLDSTGKRVFMVTVDDTSFDGTLIAGNGTNALNVNGAGFQFLGGNTAGLSGALIIGNESALILERAATFDTGSISGTNVAIALRGGVFALDNTATNNNTRMSGSAGSIQIAGGGTFFFFGHEEGTTSTLAQHVIAYSGAGDIFLSHSGGTTAPTELTLAGIFQGGSQAVINFDADAELDAGNAPRILLSNPLPASVSTVFADTSTTMLVNGTLGRQGTGGFPDSTGQFTVYRTDFATYDTAKGVQPVATTPLPVAAGGDVTANALLNGSGNTAATPAGQTFKLNTLKIEPTTANDTLDINGGGDLQVGGIVLAGANDFAITSTGGGQIGGNQTRYLHVAEEEATLFIRTGVGGSVPHPVTPDTQFLNPITKAGRGRVVLEAANTFTANSININILEGTLGVSIPNNDEGLPVSLPTENNTVRLRGGVLEIIGGGTFNRPIGTGAGRINWGSSATDSGSGGFSAAGGDAIIDLGIPGTRDDLRWAGTSNFVFGDYALIFGSTHADSIIEFADNISLTSSTTNENFHSAREFKVIDSPDRFTDFALISGSITSLGAANGGANADLLKTGDGTLILDGNNTYLGNTIVRDGILLAQGDMASSGYLIKGGVLALSGAIPADSTIRIQGGGGVLLIGSYSIESLVAEDGLLVLDEGATTHANILRMRHLIADGNAVIDLNNGAMIVDDDEGDSSLDLVALRVRTGYNGGAWDGNGIGSEKAANTPDTALGYGEASVVLGISGAQTGTFLGETVDASTVLVMYTRAGDVNLNGQVDFADLVRVAANFGQFEGEAVWTDGDVNYDQSVSFPDLILVASKFGQGLPGSAEFGAIDPSMAALIESAFAAVPEPGAALGLVGAAFMLKRRRR